MFNIMLICLGVILTIIGFYYTTMAGINIMNKQLFRTRIVTEITLPLLVSLFVFLDFLLWLGIYNIYVKFVL